MNGERFDDFAKRAGGGISRRGLIVGLAGLALGAGSGSSAVAESKRTPAATATPAAKVPKGHYPTPLSETYGTCPATGKGGDPDSNVLKNRIDAVAADAWIPVTIDAILALPEPDGTTRYMANWPAKAKTTVGRYLGAPVRMESFVVGAKRGGGETTNCTSGSAGADATVDYHLVFAAPGETWDKAVVTELTPRVRIDHPGWTFAAMGGLVSEETPVRVSGWLMLDIRHSDYVGQTRGTRWEIHPVMRLEILRNGEWVDLDTAEPHPQPPEETPVPAETPTPGPTATAGECDPSYPDVCIPSPPPDLDCGDIPFRSFRVLPPDPHGFDRDGDGIGCVG